MFVLRFRDKANCIVPFTMELFISEQIIFSKGAFPFENKLYIYQYLATVKPVLSGVLSGHSKIDKTKVLMENGSLMKVESIAECSPWRVLQYF